MHSENMAPNRLYRSGRHKMIAGVCGGLAEHFGIDPTWVRLGLVVLAYLAMLIFVPEEVPADKSAGMTE
jgi:phage shock protein C